MSEWYSSLRERRDHLQTAIRETENANDLYLDYSEEDDLESASDSLRDVLDQTEQEIRYCEKDWEQISELARKIREHIENILDELAAAGLLEYEMKEHGVDIEWTDDDALNDADWYWSDLGELLYRHIVWFQIQRAADDMADSTGVRR